MLVGRVLFPPPRHDVEFYYAAADAYVGPSLHDSFALPPIEAMACGLPAIVSDQVGCGPDLIDPGFTGELFPTGDVERLTVAMAEWSDPIRCESARAAVEKKIANYSIERAVDGRVAAPAARLFDVLELVDVDLLRVVEQPPDQRRLAVVDGPGRDQAKQFGREVLRSNQRASCPPSRPR